MLPDPLVLGTPGDPVDTTPAALWSLPVVDPGSVLGKSSRSLLDSGDRFSLDLFRSETKEAKPYGTSRTNLRLSLTRTDTEGRAVTSFIQITQGQAKSSLFADADIDDLRKACLFFALYGAGGTASLANGDSIWARLRSGEL